jgi:hypothetical protein
MGPKRLPTIWGTYMKLVTKYQIPAINSGLEKCDEKCAYFYTPAPRRGRGVYCFTSVRPSKIFLVAFFSVTVDGRNLIFGHKRHTGIPYCG